LPYSYASKTRGKGKNCGLSYRFPWHRLTDDQLLDLRICDLPIKIKGSFLEPHIKRLYSELNTRGIRFKPHVWLAEEWFSPDGVPWNRDSVFPGAPTADKA
jgi:hypothetical protein